jgi:hypothetical protein
MPGGRLSRPRARPLQTDQFPEGVWGTRPVAQLLQLRATLLADDGQADAALADCQRMLATARAATAEPLLINALVAMATRAMTVSRVERVLAQGEPSPEALGRSRRALEAAVAEPLMLDGLRGDRAWFEDQVRSVDERRLTPDKVFGDPLAPNVTGIARIDNWLHRLRGGTWSKRDAAAALRFQNLLVEIAKESPDAARTRSAEYTAFRADLPQWLQDELTHDRMFDADRRGRALLSSAVAALAAEHFRINRGRWPLSWEDLVAPTLLAAVPADPFDGQPLRFRRLADGLVIYSVGPDLADGGGEIRTDPNVGGQPKDVGVRLWEPAHRRQPPPPVP